MRALTYRGPKRVRVMKRPDPVIEHPEDAIVRVTRTAICGSDLHLYNGLSADTRVGQIFGHEFTGVVVDVGPHVRMLKAGDRVLVPFNISCGRCERCSQGLTAYCANSNPHSELACGVFGYSHTTGGYNGGQAELVRVPFADFGPTKIPEGMSDEDVLFLTDIFPTGYQGAEMGDIRQGDTVFVFGAGPVGLFAAKSAWLMGAGRVVVIDHLDDRLDFAKKWANAETVNFREHANVVLHLKKLTDMKGADVVIDAVGLEGVGSGLHAATGALMLQSGRPVAFGWAIHAVKKAGTISVVGVYGPPWNMVPIGDAMNKGVTIRLAQCNVKRYVPHLLEHIQKGNVDAKGIISHRLPLEDAPYGYEIFLKKKDGCRKVVLIPEGEWGAGSPEGAEA